MTVFLTASREPPPIFKTPAAGLKPTRTNPSHFANSALIKSLLPVIDNFERALAVDAAATDAATILKGMQIVHDQWMTVLKNQFVEPIAPEPGTPFDPATMEALIHQPDDKRATEFGDPVDAARIFVARPHPASSPGGGQQAADERIHFMPTYEYKCDACGFEFEKFQSIKSAPIRKCPNCGKSRVKRLIGTGSGLIFKGGGFYATDYRSEAYKSAAKADAGAASPAKPSTTSGGSATDAAPKSTGDTKPAAAPKARSRAQVARHPRRPKPPNRQNNPDRRQRHALPHLQKTGL